MPTSSVLDRYQYISRLGVGGSSTVQLAEDTLLGRQVALKRIHTPDDVSARSRLRREALIGASLTHPNLISIFDIVTTDEGEDVIVMEYVEGDTLGDRVRGGRKPEVGEALEILGGVASALDTIHADRIVHRDVKPSNILLGSDGSVKLADLGIASARNRTQITASGAVMGTFSYMAPEQLEGADATPAVDVYALAAVAYEVLSGQRARHEDNPLALAHAIASQPPPDLRNAWPQAPAAAADVLTRGMSRDPRARPRSAGELVGRLRTALEDQPATAPVAVPRPQPVRRSAAPVPPPSDRRRSRAPLFVALAALLVAAAIVAIALANSGGSGRPLASRSVHRSAPARAHNHAPPTTTPSSSSTTTPSAAGAAAPSAPASSAATTGSPVGAVESFYHLAASHQYPAAWALADPAFRQQLQGYQGFQSTFAQDRSITFSGANVVNQSPTSATVAVRTTSVQNSGTQNCTGTVGLSRATGNSTGWLLDHIAINCA